MPTVNKARNGLRVGDVVTIKSRISKNHNRKAIVTVFMPTKVTVLMDSGSNCKLCFAHKNLKKVYQTEWPNNFTVFDDWIVKAIENKLLKHPNEEGQANRNCLNFYHWVRLSLLMTTLPWAVPPCQTFKST